MTSADDANLQTALDQFNSGAFFACHETLEAIWHQDTSPDRLVWQGIIQIAAAFVHWQRRRPRGIVPLLDAGLEKLDRFPATAWGIDLADLRRQARAARERVARDGLDGLQAEDLPRIRYHRPAQGKAAEA